MVEGANQGTFPACETKWMEEQRWLRLEHATMAQVREIAGAASRKVLCGLRGWPFTHLFYREPSNPPLQDVMNAARAWNLGCGLRDVRAAGRRKLRVPG